MGIFNLCNYCDREQMEYYHVNCKLAFERALNLVKEALERHTDIYWNKIPLLVLEEVAMEYNIKLVDHKEIDDSDYNKFDVIETPIWNDHGSSYTLRQVSGKDYLIFKKTVESKIEKFIKIYNTKPSVLVLGKYYIGEIKWYSKYCMKYDNFCRYYGAIACDPGTYNYSGFKIPICWTERKHAIGVF